MAAAARSLSGRLLALALLVSLASSFVDQKQLMKLKDIIQSTDDQLESIKERRAETTPLLELLGEYETLMRPFEVLLKKNPPEAHGLLPVESFVKELMNLIQNIEFGDKAHDKALHAQIADLQWTLRGYKKLVEDFEEQHYEL